MFWRNSIYCGDELFHQSEEGRVEQPAEPSSLFRVSIKASEKITEWET